MQIAFDEAIRQRNEIHADFVSEQSGAHYLEGLLADERAKTAKFYHDGDGKPGGSKSKYPFVAVVGDKIIDQKAYNKLTAAKPNLAKTTAKARGI